MRYQFLRFPNGKAKALTLSYDDGCQQDLRFSDVISKYGIKCTFNLNSDAARTIPLTKEQVEASFFSRGHEIAVHGYLHRAEGSMRPIEGIQDVLNCRLELEERYGRIIRGMAYPDFGIRRMTGNTDYEKIKQYLTELDIAYSRTLGGDNDRFDLPTDWHCWMPTAHHSHPHLMEYIDKFLKLDPDAENYVAQRYPRLFYLWGHSYEFDNNNNWELLDQICEKLSGKEDIWYATNMEIYEYVNAYHSLIYSADGKTVYNPTLFEIWMCVDTKLYSIPSGATLRLE